MIRKNENLRKQINKNVKHLQNQNPIISANPSHALLLSMGQYKKQITSLVIDSIKQNSSQSVSLKKQNNARQHKKLQNQQNRPNQLKNNFSKLSEQQNKTTLIKKKKYNYVISLSNESFYPIESQDAFNKQYESIERQKLSLSSKDNRNCKSYSLSNNHDPYITKPFVVEDQQNLQRNDQRKTQNIQKPIHFQKINLQKSYYSVSQKNLATRQRSFIQKLDKSSLNKSGQNLKPSKPSRSMKTLSIPAHQSFLYPKTETYSSRSDYNIQKLRNKLDSYIKKHINQPL